jgi:hypothetical protein
MADIKIPDLPPANDPDGTELYEVVQDDISKKITGTQQQRQPFAISSQASTGYTLQAGDQWVRTTNVNPVSVLVDSSTNVPIAVGRAITVEQSGAGKVTFVPGVGVTINSPESLSLAKQFAVATLTQVALNEWTLAGYLEGAP